MSQSQTGVPRNYSLTHAGHHSLIRYQPRRGYFGHSIRRDVPNYFVTQAAQSYFTEHVRRLSCGCHHQLTTLCIEFSGVEGHCRTRLSAISEVLPTVQFRSV